MIGPLRYIDIDDFAFKWRFAEDASKWTVLPDDDLAMFHPLDENCARDLWKRFVHPASMHLVDFSKEWSWRLCDNVPTLRTAGVSGTEELELGMEFLQQHIHVPDTSQLLFFWDAECAVETTWDLFLRYWNDFCYPSDESNVAVPVEVDKNACYFEETLWIERRRSVR